MGRSSGDIADVEVRLEGTRAYSGNVLYERHQGVTLFSTIPKVLLPEPTRSGRLGRV